MANKWMGKLAKIDGAVVERRNPHEKVVHTPSPSVDFVFGNGWGLPFGYSLVLYGPPKGGKSVICNSMIGQLHKDDPDAIAVKFNTEMREEAQLGEEQEKLWGIDMDRYMAYDVNTPDGVFDAIESKIGALCQEGAPIKLVIIDSINGIQGRRQMNNDSVMNLTIGDLAQTLQEGCKRILAVQRKHKIAIVFTAHVRAEMDQAEIMRGNKLKMGASYGLQHHAEYFMMVEPNKTKAGRTDIAGNEFRDERLGDINDNAEKTAHKIRVVMKDSSMGPKGRMGEFTLDYHRGVINVHEEVFLLGVNRGVISKPNQLSYSFGDKTWKGQPATLEAIKSDPALAAAILAELKRRDKQGSLPLTEEEAAASAEQSPEASE
jgi:hypothetical protein